MHLERPLAALVVALGALAVLAILERLRRRPVVLVVASLDLFPESAVVASAAARSRRREWRDLVLRSLAALAFALALGGPTLEAGQAAGRRVRVVLGRGASLAAREPSGRTRLDLARDEVRRALERLAPEDRVDLTLLPPGPDSPAAGLSPGAALAALSDVRTVAAPGELAQGSAALAAAASDRAVGDVAQTHGEALPALVVLDREPEAASVPRELLAAARVALVGSPVPNRAVVALASRRDELGRERLLCAVGNFAPEPARLTVELRFAREPGQLSRATPLVRTVDVGAGEIGSILVDDASVLGSATAVEARLVGEDSLALDDGALALRPLAAPVRIAVVGDVGRPVETALRACEGVTVELFPPGGAPLRGFDLTVERAERDDEPAPAGACVFVCPPRDDAFVTPRLPLALDVSRARTLVPSVAGRSGGADLAQALATVKRARPAPPSNLGRLEPLVSSSDPVPVELIAASPDGRAGSLVVYLGFDTRSSEVEDGWARDASFPRFWAELVERVRARPDQPPALEVAPTGRSLVVPRPLDARPLAPLEVVLPGEPPRARPARGGRLVPLDAGLYRVRAEGKTDGGKSGEAVFAAALLDPRTSDLRGARTRGWDEATLALLARSGEGRAQAPLAGVAALLGLAFAAAAWLLATGERSQPRQELDALPQPGVPVART